MTKGITIVGGGIASLLLGVELLTARPDLPVTLFTADAPERAGGHLASWNEGGYPVEHGFHALFEGYRTALPLLRRHGLLDDFVEGPPHLFVYEGGRLVKQRIAMLVTGGRMLHFPGPSRPALIDPLRRRFVALGGHLVDQVRLRDVELSRCGRRVDAIVLEERGEVRREAVAELVLALGVGSFQALRWVGPEPAFVARARRLEGAVSLSLQAWFDHDPVPTGIDSVIGGLPEPFSTLCPVTRVRRQVRGPHGYELIACGPDTGFEGERDDDLVDRFFEMIRGLGFSVPADRRGVHVVLRRNQGEAERYLLTRPGERYLRPTPLTSIDNLSLAGAWLRVPFPLPSVEAVCQSVEVCRDALLARTKRLAHRTGGLQHGALYPPPPYRLDGTSRIFRVAVAPDALAEAVPAPLRLHPGFTDAVLIFATDYRAWSLDEASARPFFARELMWAAPVIAPSGGLGLFPLVLYLDDDVALAVGREVYGFSKRLARVALDGEGFEVTRNDLCVRGSWSRASWTGGLDVGAAVAAAGGLTLFNRSESRPPPGPAGPVTRTALTGVRCADVVVRPRAALAGARITVTPSQIEPLFRLLPKGRDAFAAAWGLEVDLAFTLAEVHEIPVPAPQVAPQAAPQATAPSTAAPRASPARGRSRSLRPAQG